MTPRLRSRFALAASVLFLLAFFAAAASAQAVFGGAQRTLPIAGLTQPVGVGVDAAGTVYVANSNDDTVDEYDPGTGTTTVIATSVNFNGMAVDGEGNVYVSVNGFPSSDSTVVKIAPGGARTSFDLGSPLIVEGLAVDAIGDIFVVAGGSVTEIPLGGSATALPGISGLSTANGIAVDAAGDIFVADSNNNRIVELPAGGTQTTVATGAFSLHYPAGVAVDASRDVFITDNQNARVLEVRAGGGGTVELGTGYQLPFAVAVDSAGNAYVADVSNDALTEIQPAGLSFGSSALNTASATWSLVYNFSGAETLTGAGAVTEGASGLDFNSVSGGTTCMAGTFGSGTNQCLLNVNFTPRKPGARLGAASLSTSAGTLITTNLGGTGVGAEAAFGPGVASVIAPAGLGNPLGMAEDESGNIYIADTQLSTIVKVTSGGVQSSIGSGFAGPTGVAVDGAGDIYVADDFGGQVWRIPADGSSKVAVGSGFGSPEGVAVDAAGNVFVADSTNNDVVEIAAATGAQTTVVNSTQLIGGAALQNPYDVAVDAADVLYITDGNGGRLLKVPTNGSAASVLMMGLSQPQSVAVDAAGDVYVTDTDDNQVLELEADGRTVVTLVSSSQTFGTPATTVSIATGVVVSSAGDVSVLDNQNLRVVQFDRHDPPSLSFASTYASGSAAQTVSLNNLGTTNLSLSGLVVSGSGFSQQVSGGTDCASTTSVGSGGSCNLQLALLSTTVGSTSGDVNITDNNLGGSGVVQTITLNGAVSPAPLTISADPQAMTYGGTVPTFTASYSGFVNGESATSLTTQPTCVSSVTSNSGAGTNPAITCSGAVDANYAISYVPAAVTVSGAPLTITANAQSMTYGGTVPTFTASYSGFVNGESATSLTTQPTCVSSVTSHSGAGTNPAITCSGAVDANYAISYAPAAVTVSGAPLTITANAQSMIYGGNVPAFTASYSGFVNGESATSLTTQPTCVSSVTSHSGAGTNPAITCSGAVDANYAISYVPAAVTVSGAPLTITANAQSMIYGGAVPSFTASYSGFVNGESATSLTTQPTCVSSVTSHSGAGTNPAITCSGAVDANYAISYAPAAVTVSEAPLTITANAQSMIYGGAVPSFTASYSGFVNGESATSLTTAPVCVSAVTSHSAVGTSAAIVCSGAVDANYAISYVPAAVTVSGAPLTITANAQSMTYGGAVPSFTASYSGFVNGESATSLTAQPTCVSSVTGHSGVGTNPAITCSGAVDANYAIAYVPGVVSVSPAPLTITANSQSMTYGGAVPSFTASYGGFVNGESAANLTTAPTCTSSASSQSGAGSNPAIVCAGAVDANYSISYQPGTLTIAQASQTITFSAIGSPSNSQVGLVATASSGLPVSFSVLSGPATVAGATLSFTGIGTVVVEADQPGNANYLAAAGVRQTAEEYPQAALSAASLTFASQLLRTTSTAQTVVLLNQGTVPLSIAAISASGDFAESNNCPASLAAGASCSISVSFAPTATGGRSGTLTVSDNAATPQQTAGLSGAGVDFTFTVSGGAALNVANGGVANFALVLNPGSYTGTATLSCAGAPAGATCSVSPATATLTAGGVPTPVSVVVTTGGKGAVAPTPAGPNFPRWPWLLGLALLPLAGLMGRRRRQGPRWALGALVVGALLAAGCGGVDNLAGPTPAGVYPMTITATSGAATRVVTLQLTVE